MAKSKARKRARRNASSELTLYAQPYDISAHGWYFKSAEEWDEKYEAHEPVEEYEIQFIDGNEFESELFRAMGVHQGSIWEYFTTVDEIGDMRDDELAALHFALEDLGIDDVDEALRIAQDEIRVTEGDAEKFAQQLIDDMGGVGELTKETREMYFDYELLGRDLGFDLDSDNPDDEYMIEMDDRERGEYWVEQVGIEGVSNPDFYFDMEAFARDMRLNGDVTEFRYLGKTWTTDYR